MILPITSYAPLVTKNDHQDNHFLGKWTSLCICFYTNKSILKDPLEFWRTPRSLSAKHWQSSTEWGRAKEQCNPSLVENCNAWIIYMSNERPQSLESEPSNRINCKTMEDNLSVKVGEIPRCHLIFIFIHYH